MGRLRLYTDERGRCAIHQSGFSWLAAVALPVWALQRRLYFVTAVGMAFGVGLNLVVARLQLGVTGQLAMNVLVGTCSGALANPLHRLLLERAGWRVTAEEPTGAGGAAR